MVFYEKKIKDNNGIIISDKNVIINSNSYVIPIFFENEWIITFKIEFRWNF